MEGEEIGMVMARASELKAKFTHVCIHRCKVPAAVATAANIEGRGAIRSKEEEEDDGDDDDDKKEEEEEESESLTLVNIRDAFEALERQLSALQALEQQQRYERESSLFQIDRSRKILLSKLREYRGDNLEVIHEALTFAGGTLDHDDDLLLPPYPSDLPDLFVMDDLYPSSHFSSKYKLTRNVVTGMVVNMNGSEEKQWSQPIDRNKHQGVRFVFGLLAKSVLTFVGVATVLSLAGFKPKLRKDGFQFKIQELFQKPAAGKERQVPVECPPGKVLVMEEGQQPRCLVKERVEIPFDLNVTAPKINYGFG